MKIQRKMGGGGGGRGRGRVRGRVRVDVNEELKFLGKFTKKKIRGGSAEASSEYQARKAISFHPLH